MGLFILDSLNHIIETKLAMTVVYSLRFEAVSP